MPYWIIELEQMQLLGKFNTYHFILPINFKYFSEHDSAITVKC